MDDSIIITNTTPILTYEGSKYINKVENLKKKERQRWSGFFGNTKVWLFLFQNLIQSKCLIRMAQDIQDTEFVQQK